MRFLDRWLGVPLCWLLSLAAGNRQRSVHSAQARELRRILMIKLSEIGSLVLAYPLADVLNKKFPGSSLYLVTFAENKDVMRVLGYVPAQRLFSIRRDNLLVLLIDIARVIIRLRRLRLDVAIDLDFFSRATAVLAFLSAAKMRAGFSCPAPRGIYRGDLFTHYLIYRRGCHVSEQYRAFAGLFNAASPADASAAENLTGGFVLPRFKVQPVHCRRMENDLFALGKRGAQPLLLVHAGENTLRVRDWPESHFIELIRSCLDQLDCFVVLVGGTAGVEKARRIRSGVNDRRCVSLAGRTTLEELLALCSVARCLLAVDAGLAHIASLTPVRKTVFFGPESPRVFSPLPLDRTRILYRGMSCSPCLSVLNNRVSACRENRCLRDIRPQEVLSCLKEEMRAD